MPFLHVGAVQQESMLPVNVKTKILKPSPGICISARRTHCSWHLHIQLWVFPD